ncbi:MAG TPA: hypothetical protein VL120_07230, partial [Solirubrobacteraceae bacterium]|nr:hypothetical protein [Solirubrobacteraceae bacterium]
APHGHHNVVNARAAAGYGSAALHLADLAALGGDDARARRHYEDALAHNAAMGARPWLARTQLHYGRWLRRGGEAARAQALLDEACATATELGLDALAARARG